MEPNHSAVTLARYVLVLATVLLAAGSCKDEPGEDVVTSPRQGELPRETVVVAGQEFTIELAYTRASRRRGLMFRDELPPNSGMLFVFDRPRRRSFYMKNCLIDLDIIFMADDGTVVKAVTMRAPKPDEPLKYYSSGSAIKYALEVQAGTARKLGLAIGQKIELPRRVTTIAAEPERDVR